MTIKSLPMNFKTKVYLFEDGSSMMRESSVNAWVLRDSDGDIIDQDKYRCDLIARNNREFTWDDE